MNAAAIRFAAAAYNDPANYPDADWTADEVAAAIDAGTVVIDASAEPIGSGWNVRLRCTPGVVTADGGFVAAADPSVVVWRRRSGTESAEAMAERFAARTFGRTIPFRVRRLAG